MKKFRLTRRERFDLQNELKERARALCCVIAGHDWSEMLTTERDPAEHWVRLIWRCRRCGHSISRTLSVEDA